MKWIWDNVVHDRKERYRSILLLCILLGLILIKIFVTYFYTPTLSAIIPQNREIVKLEPQIEKTDSLINKDTQTSKKKALFSRTKKSTYKPDSSEKNYKKKKFTAKVEVQDFNFDPNTTPRDSLKMLGFSDYSINSIELYKSKGGVYRSTEQLKRIGGVDEKLLDRVIPLAKINKKFQKKKKKIPVAININTADTTAFQSLYGIGPAYARMIINFRNKLGGFFTVDQVGDTFGLPDSTFQKILPYLKVDPLAIQKKDINKQDKEMLSLHPYLNWKEAKAIIAYKKAHGDFTSMDQLYKLYALEDEKVDTLKIYFNVYESK